MRHARQLDVIGILTLTCQEALIFYALYRFTYICHYFSAFLMNEDGLSFYLLHFIGGVLDSLHDVVVTGATAEVAFQRTTNFIFCWRWIFLE